VALAVILCALVVFGSYNTVRIWRAKTPLTLMRPSPEYLRSIRYQRFLSTYAVLNFIWLSFALIYFPKKVLLSDQNHLTRVLLYIPFGIGWFTLVATILTFLQSANTGSPDS
jgi:hypothetical protein